MKIVYFQELQDKFNTELKKAFNKINLIDVEIKAVESFLNPTYQQPTGSGFGTTEIMNGVFKLNFGSMAGRDLFTKAFTGFNIYGEFNDDLMKNNPPEQVIKYNNEVISQAQQLSEYYNWLKNKKNSNSKTKKNKNELTHAQKILALYYLGIDTSKFKNNVHSAKLLSSILGNDESNTKDYLTYFDGKKAKVKNSDNIKIMAELFENKVFKSVLDKIKEDL